MSSAIDNALSGLNAAGTRLAVAANNIANQNSTQTNTNGQVTNAPYVPQQVDQVSLSSGGVQAIVKPVSQPTQQIPDPNNANGDGVATVPNVDQATQLAQTDVASYDFKANLKVIQVQQNLDKSLLDIES